MILTRLQPANVSRTTIVAKTVYRTPIDVFEFEPEPLGLLHSLEDLVVIETLPEDNLRKSPLALIL